MTDATELDEAGMSDRNPEPLARWGADAERRCHHTTDEADCSHRRILALLAALDEARQHLETEANTTSLALEVNEQLRHRAQAAESALAAVERERDQWRAVAEERTTVRYRNAEQMDAALAAVRALADCPWSPPYATEREQGAADGWRLALEEIARTVDAALATPTTPKVCAVPLDVTPPSTVGYTEPALQDNATPYICGKPIPCPDHKGDLNYLRRES